MIHEQDYLSLPASVKFNEIGSKPIDAKTMKLIGLSQTISEVDHSSETLLRAVERMGQGLGLPNNVVAEALIVARSMSSHGERSGRILERAAYSIYISGKRNSCVRADITRIQAFLASIDPSMSKGKLAASMWRIHKSIGKESVTSFEASLHLNSIFRSLIELRPDAIRGLSIAFRKAIEIASVEENRATSPKKKAGRAALEALNSIDWKGLEVGPVGELELTLVPS